MTTKKIYIGISEGRAITSQETEKQIEEIRKYPLELVYQSEKVSWDDLIGENEKGTKILTGIVKDRKARIDNKTLMANRPPFAVITIQEGKIIRLEYYEGHDYLSKVYDVRSPELIGKEMKDNYYE